MKKALYSTLQIMLLIGLTTTAAQARQVVARSDVHYWTTNYTTGNGPSSLYLANIRGQKTWRDLVVANKNDNTVSVRLCTDDGAFNTNSVSYGVDLNPVAVVGADMNRDNYDDVLTANFGTNTISLLPNLRNRTLGTATNHVVGTTSNPGPIALATGATTGSGRQDVVVANLNESTVSVLTNAGNCVLSLVTNISISTGPTAIALADFNNDGTNDIVTANTNGTVTLLYGDGPGHFTLTAIVTLFPGGDPQPSALAVGDFNADGRLDIVTANSASNSITVLTNSPFNTFDVATNYDVGTNPRGILTRYLNRDNTLDLIVANEGSTNLSIFLGEAGGTFSLATNINVGNNPVAVSASNFNDDGMTDLATVCYGDNSATILLYDLPLAFNDSTSGYEDVPKTITVAGQQLNGNPLTYSVITAPAHGALTGSGPSYTYTPDTNYFGSDSFTYQVNDGLNDSAVATNTITLLAVNDAPSFTLATNVVSANKFTTQTYSNFASFSSGATNETNQTASYVILSLSATNVFATRPAINAAGTLTFKPSTTVFGTSTVTVLVQDNGGKSYGGTNRSPSQVFTIENPSTNPFVPVSGVYNGLFSVPGNVTETNAGSFTFTVSTIGAYSGSITLVGKRYNFSGQFDVSGNGQSRTVVVPSLTNTITLQLDVSNNTDQVTGTVSNQYWTATLLGDRLTFSTGNPAPQAGKYTLLIPGTTNSTDYPNGDSYATFTISTLGKVSLSGSLADSTTTSQSSSLSKNGVFPVYGSLYTNVGILTGWVTVTNQTTNGLTGDLTWNTGTAYVANWNTNVAISGSSFTSPAAGNRILALTNVVINLRDGGLTTPITATATLSSNNLFTVANNQTNKFGFVFNTTAGTISGSFHHPVSLQTVSLKGVVLQQQNKVEGFFKGPSNSTGHFEITAP